MLLVLFSLCFGIGADAAENRIITKDCKAKSGHYVEVEVCLRAGSDLGAGSFTLSYDPAHAEIKSIRSVISDAKVRSSDNGGSTDVVILCESPVNLKNAPLLFKVRYKKLDDADFKITVSAADCVDGSGEPISGISSAVCSVRSAESGSSGAKSSSKTTSKNDSKAKSDLSSRISAVEVENEFDSPGAVSEQTVNGKNSVMDYLPLILTVLLFLLLSFVFLWRAVSRKKEKSSIEESLDRLEKKNSDNK